MTTTFHLEPGQRAVLVDVRGVRGSAPRETGAEMLVTAEAIEGTIGGGRLEYVAIEEARRLLREGACAPVEREFGLGPKLDQCCGGVVRLGFEPVDAAGLALRPPPERTPLLLFGAGHVGRAIVHIAGLLPLAVSWIDSRADQFPERLPANVRRVPAADPVAEVAKAPPGALWLVMTHSHPLDEAITAAVLARGDARYCGLIGSETKRARFLKRFRETHGLDEERIARLTCPIGLSGPPGKAPATIAVAVVGEILTLLAEPAP